MKSSDLPPINRLAELQQLIADFAKVERVPLLADTMRPENDVEHSYGLAITCWYLAPKIAPQLDMAKIFAYALAHDIVEIHAGDTFFYGDPKLLASKVARETDAIQKLRAHWTDFPQLVDYAEQYMHKADEEAKFVYSVDKLLPVLMVGLSEKQEFFARHKLTEEVVRQKKQPTVTVSPIIAPYYDLLMDWISDQGLYHSPDEQ